MKGFKGLIVYVILSWVIVALVIWMCCLLTESALAEATTTMYVVVDEGSELNGREKPSKDSKLSARFGNGYAIEVISIEDGWAHVVGSEHGTCYASASYISSTKPSKEGIKMTVVSDGRVAVRAEPSTEADLEYWVHDGDTVTVFGTVGNFYKTTDGYIMSKFLAE